MPKMRPSSSNMTHLLQHCAVPNKPKPNPRPPSRNPALRIDMQDDPLQKVLAPLPSSRARRPSQRVKRRGKRSGCSRLGPDAESCDILLQSRRQRLPGCGNCLSLNAECHTEPPPHPNQQQNNLAPKSNEFWMFPNFPAQGNTINLDLEKSWAVEVWDS